MRSPNFDPLRFVRPVHVTEEARHQLIAEAAYFKAQKRGLQAGNDVEDWLAAEQEVDARLLYTPLSGG